MKRIIGLLAILPILAACNSSYPTGPYSSHWYNNGPGQGVTTAPGVDSHGNITANTTWTASGGPYVIAGNIDIKNGATLTLQPGTVVTMNPNVTIYIDGALNAQGTTASHILFKNATANGGGSLFFTATSTGSILRYCEIQDQGLVLATSTPDIQYCKFVSLQGTGGAFNGISTTRNASGLSLSLANCSFVGNQMRHSTGAWLGSGITAAFTNCIFQGFDCGVYAYNANLQFSNCSVTNSTSNGIFADTNATVAVTNSNLYGGIYTYYNQSANNQTATGDWWGTTITASIDAAIYDKNDNPNSGTVNYAGNLSSAANVTGCGW